MAITIYVFVFKTAFRSTNIQTKTRKHSTIHRDNAPWHDPFNVLRCCYSSIYNISSSRHQVQRFNPHQYRERQLHTFEKLSRAVRTVLISFAHLVLRCVGYRKTSRRYLVLLTAIWLCGCLKKQPHSYIFTWSAHITNKQSQYTFDRHVLSRVFIQLIVVCINSYANAV